MKFSEGNLQALGSEEGYDRRDLPRDNHYPTNPNQGSFFEPLEDPGETPGFEFYPPPNRFHPPPNTYPQQQQQPPFRNSPTQTFRESGRGEGGAESYHPNPFNHQTFLQPSQSYGNSKGNPRIPPPQSRDPNPYQNPNQGLRTDPSSHPHDQEL